MTTNELRRWEAMHVGLVGKSSLLPLPWFKDLGRHENNLGWILPIDVEINVVSIVLQGCACAWTPLKAEPFIKRMYVRALNSFNDHWSGYTGHVLVDYVKGEPYMPHTVKGTCYHGDHFSRKIETESDLVPLANHMAMISAEINFGSLLGSWNMWDKRLFRFIPPGLMQVINDNWDHGKPNTVQLVSALYRTADIKSGAYHNSIWSAE